MFWKQNAWLYNLEMCQINFRLKLLSQMCQKNFGWKHECSDFFQGFSLENPWKSMKIHVFSWKMTILEGKHTHNHSKTVKNGFYVEFAIDFSAPVFFSSSKLWIFLKFSRFSSKIPYKYMISVGQIRNKKCYIFWMRRVLGLWLHWKQEQTGSTCQ